MEKLITIIIFYFIWNFFKKKINEAAKEGQGSNQPLTLPKTFKYDNKSILEIKDDYLKKKPISKSDYIEEVDNEFTEDKKIINLQYQEKKKDYSLKTEKKDDIISDDYFTSTNMLNAIIMSEVIGKPVSQKKVCFKQK